MVVISERAGSDGERNAVRYDLLIVSIQLIIPPPNRILTAFSVIFIRRLFLINFQENFRTCRDSCRYGKRENIEPYRSPV